MFEEIESAWTADSAGYDDAVKKQLKNRRDLQHWSKELQLILGAKPLHVLDVGCGPGFFSIMLGRLGHHVKAIDGSVGMVEHARANFQAEGCTAKAEVEDAVTLPDEENESYDVIISRDVVWTLYDPEAAFARWKEVLKPDGRVIIYDGDYRRDRNDLKTKLWMNFSDVLTVITDRKLPEKTEHGGSEGAFAELPMVTLDRPQADRRMLRKVGYRQVSVADDTYRNSFTRLEYLKYGYQGKKFRVIAWN